MKKKAILAIFFLTIIISCGKNGDPEYKAQNNKSNFEKYILEFQKGQKYINS